MFYVYISLLFRKLLLFCNPKRITPVKVMQKSDSYIIFNKEQLSKIGNTMLYIAERVNDLSKTKLLKLIYILDEFSIKKGGIPFLNLKYKVWKFGPVSEELFVDLSSGLSLVRNYIEKTDGYIRPKATFDDSEFSDNDVELMDVVISRFGNKNTKELIEYTHRENSPWYNTAEENGILNSLLKEEITTTELSIDLSSLIEHDPIKKQIYNTFQECN